MTDQEVTQKTAMALVPVEQKFQLRLVPAPGRLLFASTIGNTLVATTDMFKGIHPGGEVVCLINASFDDQGAFIADFAVLPLDTPESA